MIYVLVFLVLNLPIYLLVAVAIYGDLRSFHAALSEWQQNVFSVRIFCGSIFPPFRLQLWLYLCIAASWSAYTLLFG